jgi:hypothetical protein
LPDSGLSVLQLIAKSSSTCIFIDVEFGLFRLPLSREGVLFHVETLHSLFLWVSRVSDGRLDPIGHNKFGSLLNFIESLTVAFYSISVKMSSLILYELGSVFNCTIASQFSFNVFFG